MTLTATPLDTLAPRIRDVLREHARLARPAEALDADDDLYRAGMSSHASVNVMLALEAAFGVEFPDAMLNRQVFSSVRSIGAALQRLGATG